LKTLDFYLFEKDERRQLFGSGYAIGVEYINTVPLVDFVKQKNEIVNRPDYFGHLALYNAFMECDSFKVLLDKNRLIVERLDSQRFLTRQQAKDAPERYMLFYNRKRIHLRFTIFAQRITKRICLTRLNRKTAHIHSVSNFDTFSK
jgi:hypothetical protein